MLGTLPWMASLHAAGVVGTGTPASCTQAALIARLTGGGTVTFNCGGGAVAIPASSRMNITADTIIQGGEVITIDGGLTTGLFYVVAPASLTLNDITIASAYATDGDGSAIRASGPLFLNNTTIRNSLTSNVYCGGGIWSNGPVDIRYSTFNQNSGGFGGGAICTGSVNPSTLVITNSSFNNNITTDTVNGYGGAILVNNNANLTVVDSTFLNNSARIGGALAVRTGGTAILRTQDVAKKILFLGNTVTEIGGAIYNEGTLDISRAEMNANTTPQNTTGTGFGGAIYNVGILAISDSLLSVNLGRFGGGLYSGGANSTANVQRTIFSQNGSGSTGGGLYTSFGGTVTVDNSVFRNNTAVVSGGGVSRFNTHLEISNSSITDNQATLPASGAGGGLFTQAAAPSDPALIKLTNVTISGNKAGSGQGGGIYSNGGKSLLKNLTIVDNTNGIFQTGTGVITHLGNSVLYNPMYLNCDGNGTPIIPDGHNLSSDNSCAVEQNNVDPLLGPRVINTNGINQTRYHLPLAGSPLINAAANCPTFDQRGASRPDACDIGAVEYGGLAWFTYLPLIEK